MWASWYALVFGLAGVALLALALAFGTAGVVFGFLIAAAIGVAIAVVIGLRRSAERAEQESHTRSRATTSGGAPASGEGAESAPSRTGPHLPESGAPPT